MAWTERYVRSDAAGSGDGTTDTNSGVNGAWTLDEAIAAAAAGQRVNVKAGTYVISAVKTIATAGSAATATLWQGFTTTPGDLWDTWDSTAFPYIDGTAGNYQVAITGANNWLANLKIRTGNITAGQGALNVNGLRTRVMQCMVEGTANDPDGMAISFGATGDSSLIHQCRLIGHASASQVVIISSSAPYVSLFGNVISGGVLGVNILATASVNRNIITGSSSHGISANISASLVDIQHNVIYSVGGAGASCAESTQTGQYVIANNIFSVCGTYGIDFPASVTSGISMWGNLFHSCTSGTINNIYQSFTFDDESDATSPFVAAGTNFGLLLTTEGFQTAVPQQFMDLPATLGKPSMGAVAPSSSGGGAYYG